MDLKVDGFEHDLGASQTKSLDESRCKFVEPDELENDHDEDFCRNNDEEFGHSNDDESYRWELEQSIEVLIGLIKNLVWGGTFVQKAYVARNGTGLQFSIFKESVIHKENALGWYEERLGINDPLYVPLVLIVLTVVSQLSDDDNVDPLIKEMADDILADEMFFATIHSLLTHEDGEIFVSLFVLKHLYKKIVSSMFLVEMLIEFLQTNIIIKGWYLNKTIRNKGIISLVINHDHAGRIENELNFNLF